MYIDFLTFRCDSDKLTSGSLLNNLHDPAQVIPPNPSDVSFQGHLTTAESKGNDRDIKPFEHQIQQVLMPHITSFFTLVLTARSSVVLVFQSDFFVDIFGKVWDSHIFGSGS